MTVRLHIERLVVEGFPLTGADGVSLGAALEAELTARLIGNEPASWSSLAVPTLGVEPIRLTPNAGPKQLGGLVGAALHDGLLK
jgi:hypothetical protein